MQTLTLEDFLAGWDAYLDSVVKEPKSLRLSNPGKTDLILLPEVDYRILETKIQTLTASALKQGPASNAAAFDGQPPVRVDASELMARFDEVVRHAMSNEDVLIERPAKPSVMLLSEPSFGGILTTIELLSDEHSASRLLASVAEFSAHPDTQAEAAE